MASSVVHFFAHLCPLSAEATAAVEAHFVRHTCRKNDYLYREGDVVNYLYFIERGATRQFTRVDDDEVTDWLSLENAVVVDLPSFLSRRPTTGNLHTLEDSVIWSLHYDRLQQLYQEHRDLERVGRMLVEQFAMELGRHTFSLRYRSATERYEYLLQTQPALVQRLPLTYIASFLGMTLQGLSTIRAKRR